MDIGKSNARNPSKRDKINYLLKRVQDALDNGATGEEALETLTFDQYVFLDEEGFELDKLILSDEQRQYIKSLLRSGAGRPLFPNGYNKKYPAYKQNLYNSIVEFLTENGAIITPREKINFRDVDFSVDGHNFKIVLSEPRK